MLFDLPIVATMVDLAVPSGPLDWGIGPELPNVGPSRLPEPLSPVCSSPGLRRKCALDCGVRPRVAWAPLFAFTNQMRPGLPTVRMPVNGAPLADSGSDLQGPFVRRLPNGTLWRRCRALLRRRLKRRETIACGRRADGVPSATCATVFLTGSTAALLSRSTSAI